MAANAQQKSASSNVNGPGLNVPSPNPPKIEKPLYLQFEEQLQQKFSEQTMITEQWKFIGYPGFAKWMASSNDFFLMRRFDKLNARIILTMQDRIAQKEEELDKIDFERMNADLDPNDRKRAVLEGMNGSLRRDPDARRQSLLYEIQILLKEYNDYVLAYSQMRSRHTADDRQYRNLDNWMKSYSQAIPQAETRFKDHRGDLISIIEKPKTPLGAVIERWRLFRLWEVFRPRVLKDRHVQSAYTIYHSSMGKDAVTTGVIIFSGLALLFGPMWWLNWVSDPTKKLAIISGFVLLFTTLLMGATLNRPFEVMAGTAAYAAVLMVFLQVSSNNT